MTAMQHIPPLPQKSCGTYQINCLCQGFYFNQWRRYLVYTYMPWAFSNCWYLGAIFNNIFKKLWEL